MKQHILKTALIFSMLSVVTVFLSCASTSVSPEKPITNCSVRMNVTKTSESGNVEKYHCVTKVVGIKVSEIPSAEKHSFIIRDYDIQELSYYYFYAPTYADKTDDELIDIALGKKNVEHSKAKTFSLNSDKVIELVLSNSFFHTRSIPFYTIYYYF